MKKIYYLAMGLGCSLLVLDADAMLMKTSQRVLPQYGRSHANVNYENIVPLLQRRNKVDSAIITLEKVQSSTNKGGDIYPLNTWNLYLALEGCSGEELAMHSFSQRDAMLMLHQTDRTRIDDDIKTVVNPSNIAEKNRAIDALLKERLLMREYYLENDVIKGMKSAKTINDKFTQAVLYKSLFPDKSVVKAYFSGTKKVKLENEDLDLQQEVNLFKMVLLGEENRS